MVGIIIVINTTNMIIWPVEGIWATLIPPFWVHTLKPRVQHSAPHKDESLSQHFSPRAAGDFSDVLKDIADTACKSVHHPLIWTLPLAAVSSPLPELTLSQRTKIQTVSSESQKAEIKIYNEWKFLTVCVWRDPRVRLRWILRGFLATGYKTRYSWLHSQVYQFR